MFARRLRELIREESGATAVEYGVMIALISAVIIGAVSAFGLNTRDLYCVPVDALVGDAQAPGCD